MDTGLANKTVVVTGAGGGIGRELCAGFARVGARLIGVDKIDLEETGQYLRTLAAKSDDFDWTTVTIDLASPASIQAGCQRIREAFPTIDVLVNNAALYGGLAFTPMEAIDIEEWDRVFHVNVRGSYLMIRELLPALKRAKGKVINFASGSALRGSPFLLHYVTSKGAIIGMTRALATELGQYGIRVNAVVPGLIDTASSRGLGEASSKVLKATVEAQAIKEPLMATDVVGTVLYLASAWSDAVTGQLFLVDRGLIMH